MEEVPWFFLVELIQQCEETDAKDQDNKPKDHGERQRQLICEFEWEEYFGLVHEQVGEEGDIGLKDYLQEVWEETVSPYINTDFVVMEEVKDFM